MIVAPRHYYITVRVKTLIEFQAGFFLHLAIALCLIENKNYGPFLYLIWKLDLPNSAFTSLLMKFRQLEGRFVQFFLLFCNLKFEFESLFEI
jgi:hypothetical protein